MLEINKIKADTDFIIKSLQKRGINIAPTIHLILDLDKKRISNQQNLDTILAEGNQIAKQIAELAQNREFDNLAALKNRASEIKNKSKKLIDSANKIEAEIKELLVQIPNTPHENVPDGKDAQDNIVELEWGEKKKTEGLLPHWELAEKYNIIDFKTGAQITGSGFPLYKGMGAQLQRGLINFFLDYNTSAGYDILSYEDKSSQEHDRFIEVKGYKGIKPYFYWSRNEIEIANQRKNQYFLYLVDINQIKEDSYQPKIIKNPAYEIFQKKDWKITTENYRIDKKDLD